jgi:hypothetical protein
MSMARNSSRVDNRVDSTSLDDTTPHAPEGIDDSERGTCYQAQQDLGGNDHLKTRSAQDDLHTYLPT